MSRGGRPDLALSTLHLVTAPTLLIVGQLDVPIILMNKQAYDELESIKEMKIIPGAKHLFEEPGKLNEVAELAIEWYISIHKNLVYNCYFLQKLKKLKKNSKQLKNIFQTNNL